MVDVRVYTSEITVNGVTKMVTDTSIQNMVGLLTYIKLFSISPNLYRPTPECGNSSFDAKKYLQSQAEQGYRSKRTDIESWFEDGRYTPEMLKADLIRIRAGVPADFRAQSLVESSPSYLFSHEYTFESYVMIGFISFIICCAIVLFIWLSNPNAKCCR